MTETSFKKIGTFRVTPTEFDVPEPDEYPALYGGHIDYGGGKIIIFDYVRLFSKRDYDQLVDFLRKEYEQIEANPDAIEKKLGNLEIDLKLRAFAKDYTTIVGDEDYDILKAGWQLGVKRYDKESRIAGIVGYEQWPGYEGLDRATSERINAFLWDMAFAKRRFGLDEIVMELKNRFGLDEKKAELIVRTEFANIFNKMREWAYKEKTEVKKFKWVAKEDACEKCRQIAEVSKRGVTLDELKELIKQYGGPYAREWTVHPNCRCTFVRKAGRRKRWE